MGLEVVNLTAKIGDKVVLRNVNLKVDYGEIHALMGPNGGGKSSLAYVVMGREIYEVVEGDILLDGESIKDLPTEERALKGIYMALQEPPQLPGVRLSTFLIAAINKRRGVKELTKVTDPSIIKRLYKVVEDLGLSKDLLSREINVGFSGGEKKRSELMQSILIDSKVIMLDEPDSGLDIDGIKKVAEYIDSFRKNGKAVLLITHYARLLKYVKPDRVSVIIGGEIVASGDSSLADLVEEKGYLYVKRVFKKK